MQQERVRVTPQPENHEAQRMLDEAQRAQQREEDRKTKLSSEAGKKAVEGMDELLDEIDEVLETNAEEFVRNYVQKGGE